MATSFRCFATLALAALAAACSGQTSTESGARGGAAKVALDGTSYEVRDVVISIEPGEDGWFRIDGEPAANPHEDCMPGLGAGLGLYGDLPPAVHDLADLAGKRLRVDFTGDGDEANFCFVGMGGLAGAEDAWVQIDEVNGTRVAFSMGGTFKVYDENGDGPIKQATAAGTAILQGS